MITNSSIENNDDYEKLERLRDEFAMEAMNAFIYRVTVQVSLEQIAVDSYEMADAMLKAREQYK